MRLNGRFSSSVRAAAKVVLAAACASPLLVGGGCIHDTSGVARELRLESPFKSYEIAAPLAATREAVIDAAKASTSGNANFADVATATDSAVTFNIVNVFLSRRDVMAVMTADFTPTAIGARCDFRVTTVNGNAMAHAQFEAWPEMVWSKVRLKLLPN